MSSGGLLALAGPGGGSPPPGALGARDISCIPEGFLGQFNLKSAAYIIGQRFILPRTTTIDRWYYTFILHGSSIYAPADHSGYGYGNGGRLFGRIVSVNPITGLPNVSDILAKESVWDPTDGYVTGNDRNNALKTEFGLATGHTVGACFLDEDLELVAGIEYAFLLSNTDPSVGATSNNGSADCCWALLDQCGPQGDGNVRDPDVPGAVGGWEPREQTIWSNNSGSGWNFQPDVGWYQLAGQPDYDKARLWCGHGYRDVSDGLSKAHGYHGQNWPQRATAPTITWDNCPGAGTITHAGGCSHPSETVGKVKVKNMNTLVERETSSLGTGVVREALPSGGVPYNAGDSLRVSCTGKVDVGYSQWNNVYGVGSRWPVDYSSSGTGSSNNPSPAPQDVPMLFMNPHPFF